MAYLTKVATQFQRLVHLALNANHGADDVFEDEPDLHISPMIMTRMKTFSDDMGIRGQTYSFLPADDAAQKDPTNPANLPSLPILQSLPFDVRKADDIEELHDILHSNVEIARPIQGEIRTWLLKTYKSNRGFELGTFNASILATVMKKQSAKWTDMSFGFISDVIVIVHTFIVKGLGSICTDGDICQALIGNLFDKLSQRYRKAIDNGKFLLEVEHSNIPMTQNHYFNENLQKR